MAINFLVCKEKASLPSSVSQEKKSTSSTLTDTIQASTDLTQVDYNLSIATMDGTNVDFSQFKGKTIFLNFWATWCGPCLDELPSIQRLYDKTKDNPDLVMLAVSWEKPENVISFLKKKTYTFPFYMLTKPAPKCYWGGGIPNTYIISPEGKFLKHHLGSAEWDKEPLLNSFNSD